MSSRSMLRAAEAPERFLARGGFARFLAESGALRRPKRMVELAVGVSLPRDLEDFLAAVSGGSVGDFVSRPPPAKLSKLLASEKSGDSARLLALLAGAVPFGETKAGDLLVYFLAEPPGRGVIASIAPESARRRTKPTLICQGAAAYAVMCMMHVLDQPALASRFGRADEEAVRALLDRARSLMAMLGGSDAQLRSAARALALKPLDQAPPESSARIGRTKGRTIPLAVGSLIEAFFRETHDDLASRLLAHATSSDAVVRDAVALLGAALDTLKVDSSSKRVPAGVKELARRRDVALRAARAVASTTRSLEEALEMSRQIVARVDELPPNAETFAAIHEREETLLALAELGHPAIVSLLLARAFGRDAAAVDMLAALGDTSLVAHLDGLLGGEPSRVRLYEAAIVRMLVAVGAKETRPALRLLLEENPMTNWRDGLERGVLVRELVIALGELEDDASAPLLLGILESTSQEYRAVLPCAAQALGRLRHVPALAALERLLVSPKEPVTCEAVWAVGAIGQSDASARERAAALLDRLTGLEPGAEVTRLAALAKVRSGRASPRVVELRRAIERALWEPAFRQEETSRRQVWGLRALEELATVTLNGAARFEALESREGGALFIGHEAVRHFVTRDDHRVRKAAETAFAAWALPVPKVRPYFAWTLLDLERRGGIDALFDAVRDPLGIFRHNIATRLAVSGDVRAIPPLAEATARLFTEPPTSTYEYDDAPPNLVAFVRALARLNQPEGNDVLIEGLRSENHQVRAVIAENAPDDERFVPELMAMLGDPRSFLRSRAEKSLTTLGAIPAPIEPGTIEVAVARNVER